MARREVAIPGGPALAALLAAGALLALPALAREIPTGVPDLDVRLDGTLRYNLGIRTDPPSSRLASSPTFTAGENSARQGGLSTHRLDLLGELDLAWAGRAGVRASAAAWYDDAYRDGTVTRTAATSTPGTYVSDAFSPWVLDRFRGPYGEVLDAFAWARAAPRGVPVTVKAGRHAVAWGESLMLSGATHGVGYAQVPLDLAKGFATPGVEAKELFRPVASLSAQAQLTRTLSVAAQAFLEWQAFLYPEGGTFLGGSDAAFSGPDGQYVATTATPAGTQPQQYVKNGGISWPSDFGEWGLAVRWRPDVLDTTLGLYYRRLTDKFAAVIVTANPGAVGPLSPGIASPNQYRQYYGTGIDLVGVSLARQILGASVGAEASFRHDMPLLAQSPARAVGPPVLFPSGAPRLIGNTYQARGDTLHALVNAVGVVSGVRAFSSAAWAVEVTYSRWLAVRENRDMFYASGYGVCRSDPALSAQGLARDTGDGCATRDHLAAGAGFTPTWFQVLHGVDLLAPVAASWTFHGNSPVAFGGNEGSGTWGAGIAADVRSRYRFDLRYADFFGRLRTNANGTLSVNGLPAILQNRGSVTFTAKATF